MNLNQIFEVFKNEENEIEYFGRNLGNGSGDLREVKLKNSNKLMAAKLIKKKRREDFLNETMIKEDKIVYSIIKANKTLSKKINDEDYYLLIIDKMEKTQLTDLGKLNEYYNKYNLLKLIKEDVFDEKIGDNLLRFYAKNIIDSLENLDRNYLVHFDIKPEHLLIALNLIIKISDFSLVTNDNDIIKVPGGVSSYLTTEYYYNKEKVSSDAVKKQNYFDLCSTIYFLKYGENLLTYKNDDSSIDMGHVKENLIRKHQQTKARNPTAQKIIDFLKSLILYDANKRENIDKIYRNKWLNENKEIIEDIVHSNEIDEEKIICELQKSDHLINKDNELYLKNKNKKQKKFIFKKKEKNHFNFIIN